MDIKKKLYMAMFAVALVVMSGSSGYYYLTDGKRPFIDCVYMTVISITSVGYGEVIEVAGNRPAQIFTMLLITFGMGIILYGISMLTALVIEGELSGMLRKNQMEKKIKKLKNHYIVCGGGETGHHVLQELFNNKESVVLIENDEINIERCGVMDDLLYIKGDATEDKNLIAAGIKNAAGLVISLPSDKDNLYVTMAARMLNNNLRIISRMIEKSQEPKLNTAGADRVVSPNFIGGLRMASEMIRPTVVDFLDSMLRSGKGDLRIHQITVSKHFSEFKKKIIDSGLKQKYDLLVLGSRYQDEEIKFNPPSSTILIEGMTLIIMGTVDNIAKARKAF